MNIRYQFGSSLLEVMVSIFIVSLAFMGMAGLAASAVKYSKMATFQGGASQLIEDYAERMRANLEAARVNLYAQPESYKGERLKLSIPSCVNAAACTKEEIATIDIAEWNNALRDSLPAGGAVIRQDTENSFVYDIWVFWVDPESNFGSSSLNVNADCPADLIDLSGDELQPNCIYQRIVL